MQHVPCPSCGAEVNFRATTSVLAVCAYCRTTVLKDADSVRDIGKMADLLEDYSPVRIGTSGTWGKRPFTVIGRQQLRYEQGVWSEWRVIFPDGETGWLGDFSGQFVMTEDAGLDDKAPTFEQVMPGLGRAAEGTVFRAADIRRAEIVSGEGELPFAIEPGHEAKVVDYRQAARFLTLDWSEGMPPRRYVGNAVTLKDLRCQFLRTDEEIARTAGRYRGLAHSLACPNCGSGIEYRTGMATHVVCPACHADVDCSDGTAVVLARHEEISALPTTLTPGLAADIDGRRWHVIGLLRMRETDSGEQSIWTEYLLFNAGIGFQWLVESDEGWDLVEVLDDWPHPFSDDSATWRGQTFAMKWRYGSEVIYAAGAFPWRARVGDVTKLTAYQVGNRTLTLERNAAELVWTVSTRQSAKQIRMWFGPKASAVDRTSGAASVPGLVQNDGDLPLKGAAWVSTTLLLVLNGMFLFDGMSPLFVTAFAALLLWLPVYGLITWDSE